MNSIWDLWLLFFQTLPVVLGDPRYLLIIGVVFFLVHSQYRRVHIMRKRMFGLVRGTPLQDTVNSLGYGLFGGLLASGIFIIIGISLSDTGILYLWFTAIILMLVHPRFLCFSYAAGLISMLHLLFGVPKIDIPALMALVAVLHFVEAVLIRFHGYQTASPIYIKHANGEVVGGFSMQCFWPLPFVALLGIAMLNSSIDFAAIAMPEWWPLLQPNTLLPMDHSFVYIMFPVVAALGYSDMALTSLPKVKVAHSSRNLLLYSGVLLGLALMADRVPALVLLVVLFAPFGHEWVIYRGMRREKLEKPLFFYADGVMVLDVYPNSPAEKMGLCTGDVIISVNGVPINSAQHLLDEMTPWIIDPLLVVQNMVKGEEQRTVSYKGKVPPIGIIPAPDRKQQMYIQVKQGALKSWFRRLRNCGKGSS